MKSENEKAAGFRDLTIDVVRGIAIFTMVGANMAPLLPEPHSQFLRYYSSFAAPIFICLAGSMISFGALLKPASQSLGYILKRSLFLLMVAAIIDILAWRYVPFVGMDVLYLIALTLPVAFLLSRSPRLSVFLLALFIFAATPIMQAVFGYSETIFSPSILAPSTIFELSLGEVARHWLVDGWFPVFPWLGYGLVGVCIGQWRFDVFRARQAGIAQKKPILLSIGLTVFGLIAMSWFGGPFYSREGFSELFYPATIGFITLSIGVVVGLILLVDLSVNKKIWSVFIPLGEASLFMYIVHSLVIGMILVPFFELMSSRNYLFTYAVFILVLLFLGYKLREMRTRFKKAPLFVKWVIGG